MKQEYYTFRCTACDYYAQVQGELYFDESSLSFMQTKACRICNVLFDDLIEIDDPQFARAFQKEWRDGIIKVASKMKMALEGQCTGCLRCGNQSDEIWIKDNPVCPKCNGVMRIL